MHVNRFGVNPESPKFRLITDLSFPHGASVNDGISSDLVSLSYITVDGVAEIVQELGRGALLANMDIEAAYWLIPIHPQDRILQGMDWYGLCRPLNRSISGSSSLRRHTLLVPHCWRRVLSLGSLLSGSRSSPAMVSITIPRCTSAVTGPSLLSAAIGSPGSHCPRALV